MFTKFVLESPHYGSPHIIGLDMESPHSKRDPTNNVCILKCFVFAIYNSDHPIYLGMVCNHYCREHNHTQEIQI